MTPLQPLRNRNLGRPVPELLAATVSLLLAALIPGDVKADEAQLERGRYLAQIAGCGEPLACDDLSRSGVATSRAEKSGEHSPLFHFFPPPEYLSSYIQS